MAGTLHASLTRAACVLLIAFLPGTAPAQTEEPTSSTGNPVEGIRNAVKGLFGVVEGAFRRLTGDEAKKPELAAPKDEVAKPADSGPPTTPESVAAPPAEPPPPPASTADPVPVQAGQPAVEPSPAAVRDQVVETPKPALVVEGDFVDNKRTGRGSKVWPNGDRYEGDWVNGERHGKGVMEYADGNRYDGEWVKDSRDGKGTMHYAKGNRYEGDWVSNAPTGKGVFHLANGNRYEGDFVEGKWHGKGTLFWTDGGRYVGDFSDGRRTGSGIHYLANGNRYEGDFLNGGWHGKGTLYWTNGDRYEGDWASGKRTGHGTYTWANGDRYVGDFIEGKFNNGTMTRASGARQEYVNGTIVPQYSPPLASATAPVTSSAPSSTSVAAQSPGTAWSGPTQAIRLVVPFAPGGSTDSVARALASPLQQSLGQTIVVDSRPGAAGIIANELVAKSPADGHTWGIVNDSFALNPALWTQMPYRTPDDFQLVSLIGTQPYALIAPAGGASINQLIASGRATRLTVGTPGQGAPYFAFTNIATRNRLQVTYIPFKGGGTLQQAIGQGDVPVGVMTLAGTVPARVRVVAVTGTARHPLYPDAPTLGEVGLAGADQQGFIGVVVPHATPPHILNRIRSELQRTLSNSDFAQRMLSMGIMPAPGVDFASLVQQSMQQHASGVQATGVATNAYTPPSSQQAAVYSPPVSVASRPQGPAYQAPEPAPTRDQPDNTLAIAGALLGAMAGSQQSRQRGNPPQRTTQASTPNYPINVTPQPRKQVGACRTEVSVGYSTTYCPDGTVTRTDTSSGQSSGSGGQTRSQSPQGSKEHLRADNCVQLVKGNHMRNQCGETIQITYCYVNPESGSYGWCRGDPPQGQLAKSLGPGRSEWMPQYPGGRILWIACRGELGEVSPFMNVIGKRGCY